MCLIMHDVYEYIYNYYIYTLNVYQFSVYTYIIIKVCTYIVYIFIQDLYHGARAQIRI